MCVISKLEYNSIAHVQCTCTFKSIPMYKTLPWIFLTVELEIFQTFQWRISNLEWSLIPLIHVPETRE